MNYYRIDFGGFTELIIKSKHNLDTFRAQVLSYKTFQARNGDIYNLQLFQRISKLEKPDDRQLIRSMSDEGFQS